MVEAEQGMFGEMFLSEETQQTVYQIGPINFSIKCFDQSVRKQLSCESRVVWLASVALAHWFDKNLQYLQQADQVVELGTGTGLLGVYVGLRAPHLKILMTDLERQSLELAEDNLKSNGVTNAQTSFYKWGPNPIDQKTFDLVIGSDIIYSREVASTTVAQSIGALLSQQGLAIVANDMIRYSMLEEAFETALMKEGLKILERHTLPDLNGVTTHRLVIICRQ